MRDDTEKNALGAFQNEYTIIMRDRYPYFSTVSYITFWYRALNKPNSFSISCFPFNGTMFGFHKMKIVRNIFNSVRKCALCCAFPLNLLMRVTDIDRDFIEK